ncbi:hypothetical protein NMY22_g6329 [Coprinellus aureogranulatus]|nr:hypothetical protein NMY22_g6329 [Coprinellus aureogranulatus]
MLQLAPERKRSLAHLRRHNSRSRQAASWTVGPAMLSSDWTTPTVYPLASLPVSKADDEGFTQPTLVCLSTHRSSGVLTPRTTLQRTSDFSRTSTHLAGLVYFRTSHWYSARILVRRTGNWNSEIPSQELKWACYDDSRTRIFEST